MPEGVEIYIQAQLLQKYVGKQIVSIKWTSSFNRNGLKNSKLLSEIKLPLHIVSIWSRGKVLVFETLSREKTIYITSQLGMSGHWVKEESDHCNFWFGLGKLSKNIYILENKLWYRDMRHFGQIGFYTDLTEIWKKHGPCLMLTSLVHHKYLSKNTLNQYQELVSLSVFKSELRNKRFRPDKRIAEFLMDQSRVSGIGNYLRAEILYHSKISPTRSLISLSDPEIEVLYYQIISTMYQSFKAKGLYVGDKCGAGFQMHVYKRETDHLGNKVISFDDKNGRTCYYVKQIQK